MNNKVILPVLGLLVAVAVGVYFYTTTSSRPTTTAEGAAETVAPTEPLKDPVASVDGDKISEKEFSTHYNRAKERFAKVGRAIPPSLEDRIKQSIFQQLVEDRLVQKESEKLALVVTAPEKKKALEEYQARMGGQEAFENFLKELGVSEEELNKSLVSNLMRKKLLEKLAGNYTPKASEVKEFYAKNKEKFKQQEEVQASHILFKFEKDITDDAKKAKLKAANEVLALAQKKGADFSELAKKHSEGPTAPKGGDLGWFSRGRMIKEFEEAAFKAKVGDVVGPVETVFGYHIIKTSGHKDAKQRAFAEVKDEIEQNLTVSENAKRAQVAMEKLKEKAKINVFEPSLMPKKDVTETAQK